MCQAEEGMLPPRGAVSLGKVLRQNLSFERPSMSVVYLKLSIFFWGIVLPNVK